MTKLDQSYQMIDEAISQAINTSFRTENRVSVSGGSISSSSIIESSERSFFLKTNSLAFASNFEAESDGLTELRNAKVICVPSVVCRGDTGNQSFLVLEKIAFKNTARSSAEKFGKQLAKLHQVKSNQFGWFRNNYIGSTGQINTPSKSWVDFFREHRLEFQLLLAKQNGFDGELQQIGVELCDKLPAFFIDYQPTPVLLHGDLWSGNYAYSAEGDPVIFDPAVYYGDREADIAMTELFGGFSASFYQAYEAVLPLNEGYHKRKNLYNLYHILNHLNLFGNAYYRQAIDLIKLLLK